MYFQIPPNFLTMNAITSIARKNDLDLTKCYAKKENIQEIFPVANKRNFIRTCAKTSIDMESMNPTMIGNNFVPDSSIASNIKANSKPQFKRKSRSVFKEINLRYSEMEKRETHINSSTGSNTNNFLESDNYFGNSQNEPLFEESLIQQGKGTEKMKTDSFISSNSFIHGQLFCIPPDTNFKKKPNSEFCDDLVHQLLDEGYKQESLSLCVTKLTEKIDAINSVLRGKGRFSRSSQSALQRSESIVDSDPLDVSLNFLPQRDWKFETPTRQNIVKTKLKKRSIQPAIIYRNNDLKPNIFELNTESFSFDLQKGFCQDLPIYTKTHIF